LSSNQTSPAQSLCRTAFPHLRSRSKRIRLVEGQQFLSASVVQGRTRPPTSLNFLPPFLEYMSTGLHQCKFGFFFYPPSPYVSLSLYVEPYSCRFSVDLFQFTFPGPLNFCRLRRHSSFLRGIPFVLMRVVHKVSCCPPALWSFAFRLTLRCSPLPGLQVFLTLRCPGLNDFASPSVNARLCSRLFSQSAVSPCFFTPTFQGEFCSHVSGTSRQLPASSSESLTNPFSENVSIFLNFPSRPTRREIF